MSRKAERRTTNATLPLQSPVQAAARVRKGPCTALGPCLQCTVGLTDAPLTAARPLPLTCRTTRAPYQSIHTRQPSKVDQG